MKIGLATILTVLIASAACMSQDTSTAPTQTECEKDANLGKMISAKGSVIYFSAPSSNLPDLIKGFADDESRAHFKEHGCTELQFISAESGKIVKDIVLVSLPEQISELLNKTIGFHRRQLAVIQKLQRWYEVNSDNPDAVELRTEYCANQGNDLSDRLTALIGKTDAERSKAADAVAKSGLHDEITGKFARDRELIHSIKNSFEELQGMGFSCPR